MEERAVRGVPWTVLTSVSRKGLTLISTVILARLLVPADFGLIAAASTVILLLSLTQDLGVGNVLIVHPDMDARAQGTAFTIVIGVGIALSLAGVVLAPAMASVFSEARLTGVLLALMPSVLLNGVLQFHQILLQRELQFKKRFTAQAAQGVVYATVSVALAATGWGVWSLVIGQIASVVVGTLLMLVYAYPYWVRPAWDRLAAGLIVRRGRGFLAQGGLYFLQQNSDYLIVGGLLDSRQLGYYYTSYRFAEVPYLAIADPVATVTFPAFARMRAAGNDVRPAYLAIVRLIALVSCPVGVLLSGAAEPFTRLVLGEQWLPIVPVLTILGIWAAVRPISVTMGWLLNSTGFAGDLARVSGWLLLPLLLGLGAAALMHGIAAVALVVLLHALISACWLVRSVSARVGISPRRHWRAVRPVVLACVPAWLATRLVAELSGEPPIAALPLAVAVGATAFLAAAVAIHPPLLRQGYQQIRRTLSPAAE